MANIIIQYLTEGALVRGWGGLACREAVPFHVHVAESSAWLLLSYVFYYRFDVRAKMASLVKCIQNEIESSQIQGRSFRYFEIFMGTIHVGMYLQIIYYKFRIKSLVNIIQPCHLILLAQGIAYFSDGFLGILLPLFMLPYSSGTALAMFVPDVSGLG